MHMCRDECCAIDLIIIHVFSYSTYIAVRQYNALVYNTNRYIYKAWHYYTVSFHCTSFTTHNKEAIGLRAQLSM